MNKRRALAIRRRAIDLWRKACREDKKLAAMAKKGAPFFLTNVHVYMDRDKLTGKQAERFRTGSRVYRGLKRLYRGLKKVYKHYGALPPEGEQVALEAAINCTKG
jgi:hypothetical protein